MAPEQTPGPSCSVPVLVVGQVFPSCLIRSASLFAKAAFDACSIALPLAILTSVVLHAREELEAVVASAERSDQTPALLSLRHQTVFG